MLISRFRVWTIKMKTDKWISNEEVRGANTGKRNYRHSAVLYLQGWRLDYYFVRTLGHRLSDNISNNKAFEYSHLFFNNFVTNLVWATLLPSRYWSDNDLEIRGYLLTTLYSALAEVEGLTATIDGMVDGWRRRLCTVTRLAGCETARSVGDHLHSGRWDKDQKQMHRDNSCSAASSQSMPTLQKINYIKVYIQFNRKIIWMVLQDGIIVYSGKLKEIYVCSS